MAEKRGNTEKLLFPFNTAGVLEVSSDGEKWYRVTSGRFRSWDGPRRITEPTHAEKGNPWVPMRTYLYEGPLYIFGTNKRAKKTNSLTFIEA